MPTLYRVRNDMAWDDVIQSWKENVIIPRGTFLYIFIF